MMNFGILVVCCWTLFQAKSISGTLITVAPTNTSAAVGTDAMLGCIVSNKGTDKVKWREGGNSETLTADSVSVKSNRYRVTGVNNNYNLTITQITVQDEGQYFCEAGDTGSGPTVSRGAYLIAVVLPTNLTAYWSTLPIPGTTANLTCRATYGRPPPTLTWFRDDIPYNTFTYNSNTNNRNGYGDVSSTLPVTLTNNDEGKRFRCQADYDGWERAMESTVITHLTSDAGAVQVVLATLLLPLVTILS